MAENPRRNWVGLVLTTVIGIAATVAVGWYQLSEAEKQTVLAAEERARAIRQELVALVEEHALNNQTIDLPRLARLTDQRRREERVSAVITVSELLEKAEFNILGSRYLPFERKQTLKSIFDAAYSDLSNRNFAPYTADTPNAELINQLAGHIQGGKSSEALATLKRLQEAHATELSDAKSTATNPAISELFFEVIRDPKPLVIVFFAYLVLVYFFIRRRTDLYHLARRLVGPRVRPDEAIARIQDYRAAGMPEDLIVERLWREGVPRSWIYENLQKYRSYSRHRRDPDRGVSE